MRRFKLKYQIMPLSISSTSTANSANSANDSLFLDIESIDNNDMTYVVKLFLDYFRTYQDNEEYTPNSYYYQYEFDNSQTLYEELMGSHQICISARSLHDAKIINAILRVLIDSHTFSLTNYIDLYDSMHSDKDKENIPPLTVTNFFDVISKSDALSDYEDYCSPHIKEPTPNTCHGNRFEVLPDEIGAIRVFDRQTMRQIIELILMGEESFKTSDPKDFVLNILTSAVRA